MTHPLCFLCRLPVEPATAAVELVGGLFPLSDPDFFAADETVCKVSYMHLDCLQAAIEVCSDSPKAPVAPGRSL